MAGRRRRKQQINRIFKLNSSILWSYFAFMDFINTLASKLRKSLFLLPMMLFPFASFAQIGKLKLDLTRDKPEKFEKRKLRSEKTGEKKFTLPRRFLQNTTSHYNFHFNAQNKLDAVIERARLARENDYTKLLPYYSYSLEDTKTQSNELDSVIAKATAGILLHDLRSDWVDDFYFLIGEAYYLKGELDSAYMTFQFINFNLKDKNADGAVGSAGYESGKGLSVVTPEDKSGFQKMMSRPPRRNDAFIWQIKTLIELEEWGEAAGLINTLQEDPNLPARLVAPLEEVLGYWFFSQGIYDSAAVHLENSLENAPDNQARAYREFLLAQLYSMDGQYAEASRYYGLAIRRTTDPLMYIYAHLNQTTLFETGSVEELKSGIQRLLSMARKDNFENYRDVIYLSAARLAMEIPDTAAAIGFLGRSIAYNTGNLGERNQAFLKLATLFYETGQYRLAYNSYDSLQLPDSTIRDLETVLHRKNALAQIVTHIQIIEREDSLQNLSAMSTQERDAYLKALSKRLRKERGIAETGSYISASGKRANEDTPLFGETVRGDWYFYNSSLRSKGRAEFEKIWGKRTNADNWRRESALNIPSKSTREESFPVENADPLAPAAASADAPAGVPGVFEQTDISVSALAANIPLTTEALDSSNALIAKHLYQLGKNYQNLLEDYALAAQTYEESLQRFPDSLYGGEIYSNLFYCYSKLGNLAAANKYKQLLLNQFGQSKWADYVNNPEKYAPAKKDTAATALYTSIYTQFIEGNFDEALEMKIKADEVYGTNYWTPQLLYIEAVYHVKQRQDSAAIALLNQISARYPKTDMSEKASILARVVANRDSIENYLANLNVERVQPNERLAVKDEPRKVEDPPFIAAKDTVTVSDSLQVLAPDTSQVVVARADSLKALPDTGQVVEALSDTAEVAARITDSLNMVLPGMDTTQIAKAVTDTVKAVPPTAISPVTPVLVPEIKMDSAEEKTMKAIVRRDGYVLDESEPQQVVMLMVKVDPVYSSEARTAFNRYLRSSSATANLKVTRDTLDQNRALLVFDGFENMEAAQLFLTKVRKDAPAQVSWLPQEKYSFFVISAQNLVVLKERKDLEDYLNLLRTNDQL